MKQVWALTTLASRERGEGAGGGIIGVRRDLTKPHSRRTFEKQIVTIDLTINSV